MTRREKQCKGILSMPLLDAMVPSEPTRDLPNGKVVFGLATSHSRNLTKQKLKWQVRWVDQTQYPMIVVASLSAVPQSCRTPLLKFRLEIRLKTKLRLEPQAKSAS